MTTKIQTRDLNTLRTQYVENSWRWYLVTITINRLSAVTQYGRLGYTTDSLTFTLN